MQVGFIVVGFLLKFLGPTYFEDFLIDEKIHLLLLISPMKIRSYLVLYSSEKYCCRKTYYFFSIMKNFEK